MPIVRAYGVPQVELAPLPGVRRTAAATPESEGAGLDLANARKDLAAGEAIGGPLERVGETEFARLHDEQRKSEDQTAVAAASNQLSAWKTRTLYDTETGAFTKTGKDALLLHDQVGQSFTQTVGEIANTLNTPEQRRAFAQLAATEGKAIGEELDRHVLQQLHEYKATEFQAVVANAKDDAIRAVQDPARIGQSLQKGWEAIDAIAPTLGLGPAHVVELKRGFTSDVHVGVIRNLLAHDQDRDARTYFEHTKDQIAADKLDEVQKALEIGTLRSESQQESDRITAEGGTLTEQLAKTKDLEPKLRDEVRARLEHNNAVEDKAKRDDLEATLGTAYSIVLQTHDIAGISPAMRVKLATHMPALISFANSLAEGLKPETDWKVWTNLMQEAGTDPDTFAKRNPWTWRPSLDDGKYAGMVELQKSIRNGERSKADRDLGEFRTNAELINSSLVQYGIDPKATDTATTNAIAELHRMVAQEVQIKADRTGKKPTDVDVQAIIDKILSTSNKVPGSWWGLLKIPTLGLGGYFGVPNLTDQGKAAILTTAADIPKADRDAIERQLRNAGAAVSDATVLQLYLDRLVKKPK